MHDLHELLKQTEGKVSVMVGRVGAEGECTWVVEGKHLQGPKAKTGC
jgi:hypothetical protein